nr:alpha-tocopherol transfer protein-like [Vanessa tameamea]
MYITESHPMYPYTDEEKMQIRKEFGIKDNILQEDIDSILEWFYKQPHLAKASINRESVERMFIFSKCSRERTKKRIDHFYRCRSLAPELIQTRTKVLLEPDTELWTFYRQAAMLKLFNGKRISVFKINDTDPSSFSNEEVCRNTIMLGDLRLQFDYMLSDIWIFDLKNLTLGHLLRVNATLIQKFVSIAQDGMGMKIYEIHVLNSNSLTQHLIALFKQFINPKIFERIIFHGNDVDLLKYIPKTHLPKDYGGEQPSLEEFKDMYTKELREDITRNYLIECCEHISNEALRPGDFKEEYLVGSFKKLDLD